jgi:hypothetical protein
VFGPWADAVCKEAEEQVTYSAYILFLAQWLYWGTAQKKNEVMVTFIYLCFISVAFFLISSNILFSI